MIHKRDAKASKEFSLKIKEKNGFHSEQPVTEPKILNLKSHQS